MKPNQTIHHNPPTKPVAAACLRASVMLMLAALLGIAASALQAASGDWKGATSTAWATGANWTTAAAPGAATANNDVAGFNGNFTGGSQPTYPNSAYYLGAFWLSSGLTKDVALANGGTSSRCLLAGADGSVVGQTAGIYYGVVIDSGLTGRKLTVNTRTVELQANNQTFLVASGNTLNLNLGAAPHLALNGYTLTLDGGGTIQLRGGLNNNASQLAGSIVVAGGTRVDMIGGSAGGLSGGINVQSGKLILWAANCMGAAGNSTPLTLQSGATIDSGSATPIVNAKPLTIAGDVTYGGYVNLDYGVNPVTLTAANPIINCSANTFTIGGFITNSTLVDGNALDLTKAGVGTLTLTAPIALRATQTVSVSGGVENLNGVISGSSYGITLAGAGTLNLNANNTFTGPLAINGDGGTLNANSNNAYVGATVNSGRLQTTSASIGGGAYSVAGGTLAVKPATAGATLSVASLTMAAGSALELNLNSFGNPTNPIISVSGAMASSSTVTLNLVGSSAKIGMYPLIQYGSLAGDGLSGFALGTVAPGALGGLVASNNIIYLAITNLASQVWDGTVNGDWDIGSTGNWKTNATYTEAGGFPVLFDDTATGANTNINLVGTLSPTAITVNSTAKTYSFGGSGTLAGTGTLTKQGSSTLTVTTANTLNGQVTITGGALQLGDGITANGSLGGNITDNASLIFANPADQTYSGTIDGSGSLTKTGNGNLTLGAANSYVGGTVIKAGTLTLGNAGALSSGSVTNNSGTNTATLTWGATTTAINHNFNITSGTLRFLNSDGNTSLAGNFTGSGTAYFGRTTGLSGGRSVTLTGDLSGFAGTLEYQNGGSSSSTYLFLQGAANDLSQANIYTFGQTASDTFMLWSGANNTVVKLGALFSGTGGGHIAIQTGVTGTIYEIGARNTDSVYGGVLGGGGGYGAFALTKVGTGALQLWNGNSQYSGVTTVRNGSLLAYANAPSGANGAFGNATSAVQVGDAGTALTDNLALLSGAAVTVSRPIVVNAFNTNGTVTLGGAQTNGDSAFYGAITLNRNVYFQSLNIDGKQVRVYGAISGAGMGVTKVGGAYLSLLGTNTYSGPTIVSNGALILSTVHAGGGDLTVNDGKTFGIWNWKYPTSAQLGSLVFGSSGPTTNELWEINSTSVPLINAGTVILNGLVAVNIKTMPTLAAGTYPLISYTNLAGSGGFLLGSLPAYVGAVLITNNNTLYLNVTNIIATLWTGATDGNWDTGTINWTNVSTAANTYSEGAPVRFDDTAAITTVNVVSNASPASVLVANSASQYVINGVIGGATTLTKTGTGSLTLGGANTYTGATTVSNGTLLVSGSLASAVSVAGGVLGGTGTLNGGATVQSGGTLAPQNLGSGSLTIHKQLVLAAGSMTLVQVNKEFSTSDQITATNIAYGGTLAVTNLSGTLGLGDSFYLLSAPPLTFSGNFNSIAGSPGVGLTWNFDPTNGVLSVVNQVVAPTPTNLVASVIGGQLVLDWPNGQGWRLEAQTNSLATGIGTNWVEIVGATSPLTNTISPANGTVFYRLVYP